MLSGQTLGGVAQFPMPIECHSLTNGGNLSNGRSQVTFITAERSWISQVPAIFGLFSAPVHLSASFSQLLNLKRKAFAESGRAERIAKSLAAVEAAQPTHLRPSEWRRVAEADIEDQY
jgi:hypothetical protein